MRNTVKLQEKILTKKEKLMKPWVILETTIVFTTVLLKQNIDARCNIMQQNKFYSIFPSCNLTQKFRIFFFFKGKPITKKSKAQSGLHSFQLTLRGEKMMRRWQQTALQVVVSLQPLTSYFLAISTSIPPSTQSHQIPVCLNVKVKCTLVQAIRLCTGRTAHRRSRGTALLFHDRGTRRG